MFRNDRINKTGGGVAVFCRRYLNPVQIILPDYLNEVEAICIDLKIHNNPRIVCIYRPPNCTNQYHEHIMCNVISYCSRDVTNIVMLGDFNLPLIQWPNLTSPNTRPYNTFIECINEHALIQHVNFPTRENNILDLVFSEDPLIVSQLRPADNFRFLDNVSDHTALEFRLNVTNCQKTQAHTESHYDFRRADVFLFKSLISAVNWEFILCNTAIDNSIDSMLAIFYETFWSICNKCVPIIASGRKNNIAKYPSFIVKLDSKCKRLSKRKNTQPNGMHKWRAAQNDYMLAIQQFVYNRESTILQSGDSAAFYRLNQRR